MALYRERGAPRFSEEDATLIRLLHPHLSRALQARSALDAIRPDGPRTVADVTRHAAGHAFLGRREVEWAAAGRELFESAFDGRLGAVERSLLEARDAWHAEGAPRSFRLGPMRVELAELPRRTLALFYREAAPRFGPAARLLTPAQLRVAPLLSLSESAPMAATEWGGRAKRQANRDSDDRQRAHTPDGERFRHPPPRKRGCTQLSAADNV